MHVMSHSVIFCGTPAFAVPSLEALLSDKEFDVKAVITQPDKPAGRSQKIVPPPVKVLAEEKGIPVWQPENINEFLPEYIAKNPDARPDFLIVVAYGKILKQSTLDLPKVAPINVHASILPRWRGASPIEHAILNGDTETGVTVQVMSAKLDEGPILAIKKMLIDTRATSIKLREELSKIGAALLVETLKKPLHPISQSSEGITLCKKLSRADGDVNSETMTAEEIDRKVRAFQPWPGVRTKMEEQDVKLIETSLEPSSQSIPLPCAKGTTLYVTTLQPAGKKPMKGVDWKRGLRQ
jgi:methionyl-tRNA formyltransferase